MCLHTPPTSINSGFTVGLGAVFNASPVLGNVAPLLTSPSSIVVTDGETINFSDTHQCVDYEGAALDISANTFGVLSTSEGSKVFSLI